MKKTLEYLTEAEKIDLLEGCSTLSDFISEEGVQNSSVSIFVKDPSVNFPGLVKMGGFKNHDEKELLNYLANYLESNRSSSILFELLVNPEEITAIGDPESEVILVNDKNCFAYVDYHNIDLLDNLVKGITYFRPAHAAVWSIVTDTTESPILLSIEDIISFAKARVFSLVSIFDDEAVAILSHSGFK